MEKLDLLPYPGVVRKLKRYNQLVYDLIEEFENQAPLNVIHDLHDWE